MQTASNIKDEATAPKDRNSYKGSLATSKGVIVMKNKIIDPLEKEVTTI